MTLHQKVKTTILIAHILTFTGLIFYFSWWGLTLGLATWVVFNFGVSGGYHRLFSHKQFEASRPVQLMFLFAGTLAGIGSCISWVGQHRLHHATSDVEGKDPYYSHNGIIKSWIYGPWHVNTSPLVVRDLLRDPVQKFLHDQYFKIQILYCLILLLINPILIFWMWALPSAMTFTSLQAVGVFGHIIGNRIHHDVPDQSKNSHWLCILSFGESYQNTHHYNPRQLVLGPCDLIGHTINKTLVK
jgi:stearoyl-CoA desaturase (delta-9 desaturase)